MIQREYIVQGVQGEREERHSESYYDCDIVVRKDGCDCDIVVETARTNVCVSVLSTSCVPKNGYATALG